MLQWLRRAVSGATLPSMAAEERAELLARYKRLREVGLGLNHKLLKLLSREEIQEGGRRLGILKKETLVFDSEDMVAVLMDYCLHALRRDGRNTIERVLHDTPPPEGSDERILLEAKRQAYYSLFVVEETEPGCWLRLRDLLRDESVELVDIGLSTTGERGAVFASRVMSPDGINMTTGAGLPVGRSSLRQAERFAREIKGLFPETDFHRPTPEQATDATTMLIRMCLETGAGERIAYVDAGGTDAQVAATAHARRRQRNNRVCPCGSGKKYKQCCGKR